MQLKPGVNAGGVDPFLWAFLGQIAMLYRDLTGKEMVITSLRRDADPARPSKHSPPKNRACEAADIRTDVLRAIKADDAFARMLQNRFGKELGVVLEPDWLTPAQLAERGGLERVAPHLHVQLKGGCRLL